MRKVVSLLIALGFVFSSGMAFAVDSCVKCHKTMDKVAENIKKSGVKSADELVDFLRNKSAKKALHKSVSDDDIKKAFAEVKK